MQYGTPGPPAGDKPPGRDKTMIAWICAGIGLFCCLSAAGGIYFAMEGKKAGDPQGQTALLVNVIVLVLNGLGALAIFFLASASSYSYG